MVAIGDAFAIVVVKVEILEDLDVGEAVVVGLDVIEEL